MAQKKKHYEAEIERIKIQIRDIKSQEDKQKDQGEPLWKPRDTILEQADRDKRCLSRGKIAKGPMFRHKPMGAIKTRIEELVDQLEENNQTILL